jgi:hypothetical protein
LFRNKGIIRFCGLHTNLTAGRDRNRANARKKDRRMFGCRLCGKEHGISVLVFYHRRVKMKRFLFLGTVLLILASCGTTSNVVKATKKAGPGALQNEKAIVFAGAAQRKNPSMGAYWGQAFVHILEGGLFTYPLYGGAAIAEFKGADKTIAEELPALQAAWIDQFAENFSAAYRKQFGGNAETIPYPFEGKIKPTYFSKANASVKSAVSKLCAENQAQYAVGIVMQVVHGTGGGQSTAVSTQIKTEVCVFDSTGKIVAQGKTATPMLRVEPSSLGNYVQLYAAGEQNTESLIGQLAKAK